MKGVNAEFAKEYSRLQSEFIARRLAAPHMIVHNHPDRPVIEFNIPPPVERRGGARKWDHFYPFEHMTVGSSFWVPSETNCTAGAVTAFAKKSGWKFVSRGQTYDGQPNSKVNSKRKGVRGTRVWRTE